MRFVSVGCFAAALVCCATLSQAHTSQDVETLSAPVDATLGTSLSHGIALEDLVSPQMSWSQLKLDAVKAQTLFINPSYASTTPEKLKAGTIQTLSPAQDTQVSAYQGERFKALTGFMMLAAGFVMWCGLFFQRRY